MKKENENVDTVTFSGEIDGLNLISVDTSVTNKGLGVSPLKDSGSRESFDTGAVRDNGEGKGRFDLLSTQMLFRLAKHYENGSKKYSERNFEKGMPISRCVDAAMRHLTKYLAGWNDEDHLAAVCWNVAAIMLYEHRMPELMDLPERDNNLSEIQKFCFMKED